MGSWRDNPPMFPDTDAGRIQRFNLAVRLMDERGYTLAEAKRAVRNACYYHKRIHYPGTLCGAICKRTGLPCKAKGMTNGRCRMHGGASRGPNTPEGIAKRLATLNRINGERREAKRIREEQAGKPDGGRAEGNGE